MPRRRVSARVVPAIPAGSWQAARTGLRKLRIPDPVPISAYTRKVAVQIGNNGVFQGVIAAGGGSTVSAGPSGVGTRWYPQQITLATKTGAADTSTAVIYLGAIAPSNIVATSQQAGGDVIGLAVPEMQPGDLLIAVWSGGTVGDWTQLAVIGQQEILTTG
jgi:hypothetical protein